VAMTFEGRETTFGQLDRRASRVANGLLATCTTAQARIAVLDKNSDLFYELLFGAAKARDVLVPVNWRLAPPEIAYIVNDAEAELLFVGEEYVETIERLLPELRTVKRVIALAGGHPAWEGYAAWRDHQSVADPRLETLGVDVAIQLYTSGTTGRPKGAQLTQEVVMVTLATGRESYYPCSADDVNLLCMPQYHWAGTFVGLFALHGGARTVIARQFNPTEILQLIPSERITRALIVPAAQLALLNAPGCEATDFSSLVSITYGASPIPLDLLRQAMATFECDFRQAYGLTEIGVVTHLPPEDHDVAGSRRMRSCGKPLPTAEIKVVGEDGAVLPPDQVGEIVVRTPQLMKGYWRLPEATAASLRNGWFSTGDAGYFDEDGYLYIYDRVKDMIVSGGENVYPAEVESAMFGHPAVADVAVIGVPDERWGETVKAVVVRKPGVDVTEAELVTHARERIAHYKAPKSVDFVEELPRNPSGKILKRILRAPYWEGFERQVN